MEALDRLCGKGNIVYSCSRVKDSHGCVTSPDLLHLVKGFFSNFA